MKPLEQVTVEQKADCNEGMGQVAIREKHSMQRELEGGVNGPEKGQHLICLRNYKDLREAKE